MTFINKIDNIFNIIQQNKKYMMLSSQEKNIDLFLSEKTFLLKKIEKEIDLLLQREAISLEATKQEIDLLLPRERFSLEAIKKELEVKLEEESSRLEKTEKELYLLCQKGSFSLEDEEKYINLLEEGDIFRLNKIKKNILIFIEAQNNIDHPQTKEDLQLQINKQMTALSHIASLISDLDPKANSIKDRFSGQLKWKNLAFLKEVLDFKQAEIEIIQHYFKENNLKGLEKLINQMISEAIETERKKIIQKNTLII